ncbi:IS21 family transposase [Alicyclobacillus acidoterrestris]|uniref:IS21 family transposase n=1 Tax=Alicyclobacillus acidoterrestris (strain ATCC 49025 / DSM 3922 / CIP 106132 / NCIMB 13137 / GD3B) TaxID=1356854 RepID=A0A9E6ZL52_ALIAG|nr:IS21 family transposase [Alicyclobacillus acidoterrestris]UNO48926.1 IS21 family transposase [Alicyclobacillus acidoterrestris]
MTESEKMEVRRMYQEGVSISELSRRTGHDRKTIRKVVQEQEDGKKPLAGTKRKGSKLEPYKPYVEQRMRFGVLNAERILREIREQGYTGGITVLREFMHPLRPAVSAKATVRFETGPGEQAQIDLGAFPYIDAEENRRTLWCFAMVLSYSRMLYLEFIKASDQLHILQALRNALEFFDGVPKTILSDNCAPLVLSNDGHGHVEWQPAYLDFAKYYGFVPKACKPYRSRTKGKIERPIRYIRDSFWPTAFVDLADVNQQAVIWRDTVANIRIHGTTHERPQSRFPDEKLQRLPKHRYLLAYSALRKVLNDCRISWNASLYSVPWQYVGKNVLVRTFETGRLQIEYGGQVIAEHSLVDKHQVSINPEHVKGIPMDTPRHSRGKVAGLQVEPDVEQRDLDVYEQITSGGQLQ